VIRFLIFFWLVVVPPFNVFSEESDDEAPEVGLTVGRNLNETIYIPNLKRVAVGNSKIVRVKSIPPSTLLVTGLSLGKTAMRVWNEKNRETLYLVTVVAPESLGMKGFDPRGRVVRVSLEFLELDESVGRSSGIQWPESLSFSGAGSVDLGSSFSGLNYSSSVSSANGFLNLLVKQGWARVLASPELFVRLGEQAVFHSGGEFPVSTGSDSFGRYQRKVDWKKYGLTAKVKSESADELHFQTDIQLEISELDQSYQVENVPALTTRNMLTKIDSIDGETVILSGLVRRTSQRDSQTLPLLGKIPLLGNLLFGSENIQKKETELLMAVSIAMTSRAFESQKMEKFRSRYREEND